MHDPAALMIAAILDLSGTLGSIKNRDEASWKLKKNCDQTGDCYTTRVLLH